MEENFSAPQKKYSPEVLKEYEEFSKFCESKKRTGIFYVQEDVDKANKMLDVVIKELSS
ncbi:MAG: hypothetical protein Q7K54_03815 [Candidatus Parcubacteria bacterium]|nr:hypothetical protein [Candidatus Parcubacteria bacterium]